MKLLSAVAGIALATLTSRGALPEFDTHFADSTLRIDYIFSGGARLQPAVLLDAMHLDPAGWAGRRHRLDSIPIAGNGSIRVIDPTDSTTLYLNTFSSLFAEWLLTDEAATTPRSMENVFLLPWPRHAVDVEVALFDSRGDTAAVTTHRVDPADILISRPAPSRPTTPHRYLLRSGSPAEKIDVAILAEGYTEAEMDSFYLHAATTIESLRAHEPFGSLADRFNFVAVAAPSVDSGVSIPRYGDWKDTAAGSHFSTFYSNRYLTTPHLKQVHDLLTGIPYEHIIILANTDEYGGGGIYNSYTLTTARHKHFPSVVVHEFGHSFGGLGDEYFYDNDVMTDTYVLDVEPWEPNVTSLTVNPVKWSHLLEEGTPVPTPVEEAAKYPVGVYEGAAYTAHGMYRPADHCRMRDNTTPGFCPVCQDALRRLILFMTAE